MNCLAHLTEIKGKRLDQTLKEHCIKTAEYASESLKAVGFYYTAYVAGLLHDMGKATEEFNRYLETAFQGQKVDRGSVNHTFAGVIYLLEKYHVNEKDIIRKLTSEIISYAIGAHHGLFDCVDLDGKNGFLHRLHKDRTMIFYKEAYENYFTNVIKEKDIENYFEKAVSEIHKFFGDTQKMCDNIEKAYFQFGFLGRMITSAVIYGDRRDTREFMSQISDETDFDEKISWGWQREFLEERLKEFAFNTEINKVRQMISNQCFEFAQRPTGIYRVNVPTGGGKTLSTLRYALAHAEKYKKSRVIFIIPLLSILDQNAKVIREYLADKNLLTEHHSNVINESVNYENIEQIEVVAEDWESPIIISTLVQLLNMLFSHKTSDVGRMRALCNSVIVIDEVQSLPKRMTEMFNMAMNFLSKCCNTTIILSSATQPCFEKLDWTLQLSENPDMVQLSKNELNVFKRNEIIDKTTSYGMDDNEWTDFCSSLMEIHNSLLVICNTREEARSLFIRLQTMQQENDWNVYHLSTSMCQNHRMDILAEIQEKLKRIQENERTNEKIICVSTQLVEAGIDFSFENVVRVLAGLDNLIQAAGRCNRSNEYKHLGKVYLINLKNEKLSMLREIALSQQCTRRILVQQEYLPDKNLTGDEAVKRFYQYFFEEMGEETKYEIKDYGTVQYLAKLLANVNKSSIPKKLEQENMQFFLRQPFKTVAKEFKVFDNETVDIIVPYKEGKQMIDKIREMPKQWIDIADLKAVMKEAKQYTISVYQWQINKLSEYGLLEEFFDGKVLALEEKMYSYDYGMDIISEQDVGNYIF